MPNQKYKEFLTKITTEDIVNKMSEDKHVCPKSVGNVDLNTKNRDLTTKKHGYGPLNVDEPGDFWVKIAKQWDTSTKAAKMSLCANCGTSLMTPVRRVSASIRCGAKDIF